MGKEDMISTKQFFEATMFIYETRKKCNMNVAGAHDFGYHSSFDVSCNPFREWMGCPAGMGVLGIQSNGNVKGCLSLPDEFIEGNIRNGGLKKIWESEDSFKYTRKFEVKNLKGPCKKCPFGATCRGGCTDVAYASSGGINNNCYCGYLLERGNANGTKKSIRKKGSR